MLTVIGNSRTAFDRMTRRSFVQAGLLGVGGLSLTQYLQLKAAAGLHNLGSPQARKSDTAVILIWMSGGPGHHETWDPKPAVVPLARFPRIGPVCSSANSSPNRRRSPIA